MGNDDLFPCFLGPYGENDELFERVLVELLRDHVYWRRNFHPDDPPAIPTSASQTPHYQAFAARMRRELHQLTAALKRSVPFHSPRYLGHMVSDLLLPGLLAQMVTLPYNPNNVVDDVAPVTLDMELEAGLQLARMVGYPADEHRPDCAFGYLPSGGTAANYQSLRLALALRYLPVALKSALRACGTGLRHHELPAPVERCDDWHLVNLPCATVLELHAAWQSLVAGTADAARAQHLAQALAGERIESLGLVEFHQRHPELRPPIVYAPATAHYSWHKAMQLTGLGSAALRAIPERGMRADADALHALLDGALGNRQPVLMVVGVLGTTEFGTIDPIAAFAALREDYGARGLGFSLHVDAAWGGYLATLFREPDGSLRERARVRAEFGSFPREPVYEAYAALARTDSITIDPHKLGYLPFGTGGFVCRDHRALALLAQDAPYVFNGASAPDYRGRFRALGRYIVEGSKSGAAAAAACVTHRVLPLDWARFGRLPAATIGAAERFCARARLFARNVADVATACIPIEVDTNLVCLALNPAGNRSVGAMNRFVALLVEELRVDARAPVQLKQFFASSTALAPDALGPRDCRHLLEELGLDGASLVFAPTHAEQADRLLILRHTLMNPFLHDEVNGIDYVDRYFEFLEERVRALSGESGTSRA